MSDAAPQLNQAYELVESGDREAALELLSSIQSDFETDPDYWWIYAHAVDDAQEGQAALQRVAALKPDYPGINNLTQQASQALQSDNVSVSQSEQPVLAVTPPDADDADLDDDVALDGSINAAEAQSTPGRLLAAAGTIIALVIVAGLLLTALGSGDDAEPTSVAEATEDIQPVPVILPVEAETEVSTEPTEEMMATEATDEVVPVEETETSEVEPTEEAVEEASTETIEVTEETTEMPTEEATNEVAELTEAPSAEDQLVELLRTFDLVEGTPITTETTTLGETLVVNFCAQPGPAASTTIGDMGALVAQALDSLPDDITAVGFGLTDCANERRLRIVGVPRRTVEEYGVGDVSFNEFQTLLRPIG